jgi:hypothetical protein
MTFSEELLELVWGIFPDFSWFWEEPSTLIGSLQYGHRHFLTFDIHLVSSDSVLAQIINDGVYSHATYLSITEDLSDFIGWFSLVKPEIEKMQEIKVLF